MIEVQVDHSRALGEARDQGMRPTCLAFAAADLNAAFNATKHLSVEFLCHYAARLTPSWTTGDGFTIDAVLGAASDPGTSP